jgi:hypothetical protein
MVSKSRQILQLRMFIRSNGREKGLEDWFDVDSIRDHIIKVKMLIFNPFSDFVEKPIKFESHGSLLFDKMYSNLSFEVVEEERVYVIHKILTSRSDYFRAMLEGPFKEAQVPITVESKIPIHGVVLMCSR